MTTKNTLGDRKIALQKLAPEIVGVPDMQVASVAIDSRLVTSGALFLALAGAEVDGHDFIDMAISNGAIAVFSERTVADCTVPVVVVDDLAARVSQIAGEFFDHPSSKLSCVAVTGTNGKTSVAHFVASLADQLGITSGFLGTTGWGMVGAGRSLEPAALTTADAVSLQERLVHLEARGCELVALELSSHALQQHRADALQVDVALFTNLSRDHLDYHGSMAAYGAAKARLFEFPSLKGVVVNAADSFGAQLASRCAAQARPDQVSLSLVSDESESPARPSTSVTTLGISERASHSNGMTWLLDSPWGTVEISTPVIGSYNALNLSLAVGALALLGHDLQKIADAVPAVTAPAGRLQPVSTDRASGFSVFVDYAHTPDALVSVLTAVRSHCSGRLICVFGCGGDRDKGKRAPMGQAVQQFADVGVLTSDNPRFEDPLAIIADVEAGLPADHQIQVQPDRGAAIALAIDNARVDDVVIIAGKGHEDYQDINGQRLPFDDLAVAREQLERRAVGGAV